MIRRGEGVHLILLAYFIHEKNGGGCIRSPRVSDSVLLENVGVGRDLERMVSSIENYFFFFTMTTVTGEFQLKKSNFPNVCVCGGGGMALFLSQIVCLSLIHI